MPLPGRIAACRRRQNLLRRSHNGGALTFERYLTMKTILLLVLLGVSLRLGSYAFGVLSFQCHHGAPTLLSRVSPLHLSTEDDTNGDSAGVPSPEKDTKKVSAASPPKEEMTEEQKKQVVGNLVADDEWMGLTMELSELVRLSIVEDMKKNAREFLDSDDYKVGDLSKQVDSRVKSAVASMRGKDKYELVRSFRSTVGC